MRKIAAAFILALSTAAQAGPASYVIEQKIALPDGGWDLATFDPVMRRVYLARTDAVTAFAVDTGAVSRLAAASRSHTAIAVNGGREVLVTDAGSNTARFVDAKSGSDVAAVKVGTKPDAAMIDSASGLALVMNAGSGDVTLIDPVRREAVGGIAVGGSLELAVSDGHGRVFLNVEDKNELVVLDVKAKSARHVALPGCHGPTGIAYLPVSHRVLSTCANGVAAITNATTLTPEQPLPLGKGPDTALYDPVRHLALVPCGGSGELAVFADTAAGVVAADRIPTQRGARTGALDPKTGRVYLPAADYLPATTPVGRPQVKPGSVVMLVLKPAS